MDLGLLNHTLDSIGEVINFLLLDDNSDLSDLSSTQAKAND